MNMQPLTDVYDILDESFNKDLRHTPYLQQFQQTDQYTSLAFNRRIKDILPQKLQSLVMQ